MGYLLYTDVIIPTGLLNLGSKMKTFLIKIRKTAEYQTVKIKLKFS